MTITKKLLTIGVVVGILATIFAFLPGGMKGKFLGSSAVTQTKPPFVFSYKNTFFIPSIDNIPGSVLGADRYGNIYAFYLKEYPSVPIIRKYDFSGKILLEIPLTQLVSKKSQWRSRTDSVTFDTENNMYIIVGNSFTNYLKVLKYDQSGKLI